MDLRLGSVVLCSPLLSPVPAQVRHRSDSHGAWLASIAYPATPPLEKFDRGGGAKAWLRELELLAGEMFSGPSVTRKK